jgi:hypothetical protein
MTSLVKTFPDGATAVFLDAQGEAVPEGDPDAVGIRILLPDGTVVYGDLRGSGLGAGGEPFVRFR